MGKIYKKLDEPQRFLFWTLDESIVIILPLLLTPFLKLGMYPTIVSILGYIALNNFKKRYGKGKIKQFLHWHLGIFDQKLKRIPASSKREFLG